MSPGTIVIGAMTRHLAVANSAEVQAAIREDMPWLELRASQERRISEWVEEQCQDPERDPEQGSQPDHDVPRPAWRQRLIGPGQPLCPLCLRV